MLNDGRCNLCDTPDTLNDRSETAAVRSNVRRFQTERFTIWRCASCRSLHARDEVDLDHYYAHYPFHGQKVNWMVNAVHRNFRRRLRWAGMRRHHRVLDYGCGSGLLVEHLRSSGFAHTFGYDAYSDVFNDPAALDRRYDFLIAQDVVEHVHDPRALLRAFDDLVSPGGVIVIGTPNAEAVDLGEAERFIHCLHQPYHTHMFSKTALLNAGRHLGWTIDRVYMTQYTNTLVPCLNLSFGLHFGKCFDNNLDLAFDPPRVNRKLLLSPRTPLLAMFGWFFAPETDITVVFRTA